MDKKNSTRKTKTLAFEGRYQMQSKIVINNNFQEQINTLSYTGCPISYQNEKYIIAKISKLLKVMGIINITLKPSQAKKHVTLVICNTLALVTLLYRCKIWAI
jgi:hypothetical protein